MLDLFLPGILALLAYASGAGPGFSTVFELRAGVIERFRVTPASRLAILAGPILASMLLMFLFDLVLVRRAGDSASTCTCWDCSCSPCCWPC